MSEVEIQNLLAALTEAHIAGKTEQAKRLAKQGGAEGEAFATLIQDLDQALVSHEPSEKFLRQLKRDLVNEPQGMVERLRSIPGRVHIATGLAAGIAGWMLLTRRHPRAEQDDLSADAPPLPQGS